MSPLEEYSRKDVELTLWVRQYLEIMYPEAVDQYKDKLSENSNNERPPHGVCPNPDSECRI
jgi:hypothetical protein